MEGLVRPQPFPPFPPPGRQDSNVLTPDEGNGWSQPRMSGIQVPGKSTARWGIEELAAPLTHQALELVGGRLLLAEPISIPPLYYRGCKPLLPAQMVHGIYSSKTHTQGRGVCLCSCLSFFSDSREDSEESLLSARILNTVRAW